MKFNKRACSTTLILLAVLAYIPAGCSHIQPIETKTSENVGKKVKAVLFDFDGTICDSYHDAVAALNHLAPEFNFKRLSEAELLNLKGVSSYELFRAFEVPKEKLPQIVERIRSELQKKIPNEQVFPGIKDEITQLRARGFKVGIVTSNSEDNVMRFVHLNNLKEFDFVYGGGSLSGKAEMIKSALKKLELEPSEAIYVGDETRDIDAARQVGMSVIAVSWGYNSKSVLEKSKPDYLVDSPTELLKLF